MIIAVFPSRCIRRREVLAWQGDAVVDIRSKIKIRAHVLLAWYTLVIVWINLCYVVTYDTLTIWYVIALRYRLIPFPISDKGFSLFWQYVWAFLRK